MSTEEVKLVENEVLNKEEKKLQKANEPLEIGYKIINFIFSFGLAIVMTYESNGYDRKYNESLKFIQYGRTFYGILVVVFILLGTILGF